MHRTSNNPYGREAITRYKSLQDRQAEWIRVNLIMEMQDIIEADTEIANIFYLQMIQKIVVYPMICSFAPTVGIHSQTPKDYAITYLKEIKKTPSLCCGLCPFGSAINRSCSKCTSIVRIIKKTIEHRNFLSKITDASKVASQNIQAFFDNWQDLATEVLRTPKAEAKTRFEKARSLVFPLSRSERRYTLAEDINKFFFSKQSSYNNIVLKFIFRYMFMPIVTRFLENNPQITATYNLPYPDDEMEKINALKTTDFENWDRQRVFRNQLEYFNHMSRDQCFDAFDRMTDLVEIISDSQETQQFDENFRFLNSKGRA